MVHPVQDNAHTLPGRDERSNTDEPAEEWQHTPSSASMAERNEEVSEEASDDTADTQATSEDHTRTVAIANRPADEVGMSLSAKRVLHSLDDGAEGSRVGGGLQSAQNRLTVAAGKV